MSGTKGATGASMASDGRQSRVYVRYFAALREWAGVEDEVVAIADGEGCAELYERLRVRHGFGLPWEAMGIAVNDEFAAKTAALVHGDRVVFIAPVAGG